MARDASQRWAGPVGLARRVIEWWALAGGVLLLAIVLMTTWSAFSGVVFARPFPGDFELTEVGVAIAAFAFLPYCQLTGANVTADIFTAGAGPRLVAMLSTLAAAIAFGFSLLLLWRMQAGLVDYREYVETTAILQIPLWMAFVPILASLALLAVAALISLSEAVEDLRRAGRSGRVDDR